MDPMTLLAIASAGSSILGGMFGGGGPANSKTFQHLLSRNMQMDPSAVEQMLQSFASGQNPMAAGAIGSMNAGQDAISQMLRAQGPGSVGGTYQSLMETGNPFDTSAQFKALMPVENQMMTDQVAGLRGRAGSLGQRFGSASAAAEGQLRGTLTNQFALNHANIANASYEAAQQRRLAAAGGYGSFVNQSGAALAGLGAQQYQTLLGGLQAASAAEGQRRSLNTQLLGLRAGMGAPTSQAGQFFGNAGQNLGDLASLLAVMRGLGGGGGGSRSMSAGGFPSYQVPTDNYIS